MKLIIIFTVLPSNDKSRVVPKGLEWYNAHSVPSAFLRLTEFTTRNKHSQFQILNKDIFMCIELKIS